MLHFPVSTLPSFPSFLCPHQIFLDGSRLQEALGDGALLKGQVLYQKWVMLVGIQALLWSTLLSCPFTECPMPELQNEGYGQGLFGDNRFGGRRLLNSSTQLLKLLVKLLFWKYEKFNLKNDKVKDTGFPKNALCCVGWKSVIYWISSESTNNVGFVQDIHILFFPVPFLHGTGHVT